MIRKKLVLISEQILQRNALACLLTSSTEDKSIEEYQSWSDISCKNNSAGTRLFLVDAELPDSHIADLVLFAKKQFDQIAIIGSSYNKARLIDLLPFKADAYLTLDSSQSDFIEQLEKINRGDRVIADSLIPLMMDRLSGTADEKNQVQQYNTLTTREKQILNLLAAGYTNNLIAKELVISVYTVKNHVHNVLEKLGLENRTQLVAYAFSGGLVG